jgi:hypothetical protein
MTSSLKKNDIQPQEKWPPPNPREANKEAAEGGGDEEEEVGGEEEEAPPACAAADAAAAVSRSRVTLLSLEEEEACSGASVELRTRSEEVCRALEEVQAEATLRACARLTSATHCCCRC